MPDARRIVSVKTVIFQHTALFMQVTNHAYNIFACFRQSEFMNFQRKVLCGLNFNQSEQFSKIPTCVVVWHFDLKQITNEYKS